MAKTFICDSCGQKIIDTRNAMLEWTDYWDKEKDDFVAEDFRIVHNKKGCALAGTNIKYSDRHLHEYYNMKTDEIVNEFTGQFCINDDELIKLKKLFE